MGEKFVYGKLNAIRVILAIVQNGTDLCFHMQGSRDITFNIILLVLEKEVLVLQLPKQQLTEANKNMV